MGQKTLAVAIHYSDTADASEQMRELVARLDPLAKHEQKCLDHRKQLLRTMERGGSAADDINCF